MCIWQSGIRDDWNHSSFCGEDTDLLSPVICSYLVRNRKGEILESWLQTDGESRCPSRRVPRHVLPGRVHFQTVDPGLDPEWIWISEDPEARGIDLFASGHYCDHSLRPLGRQGCEYKAQPCLLWRTAMGTVGGLLSTERTGSSQQSLGRACLRV